VKKSQPSLPAIATSLVALLLSLSGVSVVDAQEMDHSRPSVPSSHLTVRGLDGKTLTISPDELGALPHKTVAVFNAHTKANEKYSGVVLADLLAKIDVPLGEKVKGRLFMIAIIAEGTDSYRVLYSLAEVDPAIHTGDVIVADSVDGRKLGKDGVFKIVSTEERRPARWVRNLTEISVVEVKP
jgi:hypothetical protein